MFEFKSIVMRMTFAALIILLLVDLLIVFYIYRRIIVRYFKSRIIKAAYWTVNLTLMIGFAALSYIIKSKSIPLSSVYLMWGMYIYFLFLSPKLVYALISILDYPLSAIRKKKTRIFSVVGFTLGTLLFAGMLWGTTVDRIDHRITKEKIVFKNLPASFDGYRIVQFSDTHLGNYIHNTSFVNRMVAAINELQPDLILFTGDLVNTRASELPEYMPILSQLKAKDGVYSVLGNHDYGDYVRWDTPQAKRENLQQLIADQKKMGWKILNNETDFIRHGNDSIALIGVENWGEPPFPQHGNLKKAMQNLPDTIFKLLMTHNPIHWDREVLPDTDIALSLSGHTHAMQIKLSLFGKRWSPAEWVYPRWGGLYREEEQYLYVNEGTGYVFIPMRFGTKPEITLITLNSQKETAPKPNQ